jgi:hypothetical protein
MQRFAARRWSWSPLVSDCWTMIYTRLTGIGLSCALGKVAGINGAASFVLLKARE